MERKLDVVGIGTPMTDIIQTKEETSRYPGGSTINTVSFLSNLRLRTGLIGRVGKDSEGDFIVEELQRKNIDISRLRRDQNPTPKCFISVDSDSKHFISILDHRRVKLDDMDFDYLKSARSIITRPDSDYFGDIASFASKNNIELFLSLTSVKMGFPLDSILDHNPSIVFCNEKEFKNIEHIADGLSKIVITKGNKRCTVIRNKSKSHHPAIDITPVDPTGAGDAFAAGFIYGHLKKWDLEKTARFANTLGGLSTASRGGREYIPSLKELEEL